MPRVLLLSFLFAFFLAAPASARLVLSTGAGVFDPWQGSSGYEINAAVFGTIGRAESWRLGGEFSYRTADTGILSVDNVDFDAYRLSFVAHYRFLVGKVMEPYLGIRLGAAAYRIDRNEIERQRPLLDVSKGGFGLGASGIIGVDVPLGDRFALYSEFSAGTDVLWSDDGRHDDWDLSPYNSEEVGGMTWIAGIRLRF
jgi:opacity protein-like surface antigen